MKRNRQIDVKRALTLAGTFHFLFSCAKACLLPFLTLYFRQLGLDPMMAGVVMGTKHLISLIWSPVASLLAKHYNKRRAVISGSVVCSAAVALVLLVFPPSSVHLHGGACNTSQPGGATTQSAGENAFLSSPAPASHSTGPPLEITTVPLSQSTVLYPTNASAYPTKTSTYRTNTSTYRTNTSTYRTNTSTYHTNTSAYRTNTSSKIGSFPAATNKTLHLRQKSPSPPLIANASVSSSVPNRTADHSEHLVRNGRSKVQSEEQLEQEARFEFLGSLKVMDVQHQLFFLVLIIVSVWEITAAPLEWTADDGLHEYLDFADASDRYGSTRVWGLLGAACGAGAAGALAGRLDCAVSDRIPRGAAHFFCYAGLAAAALPVAMVLPLYRSKKRDKSGRLLKAAQLVRGSPRALLCAATALLVGMAGSAVDNFLLWQMQDHGSGELHMGLSLALARLSQAAFPLLATRVTKLLGPERLLVVAAASLGVQSLYFSFLWGPWAALPAQLLSLLSSGAFWWAVKVQCDNVATPGNERSVRRVYELISMDLGSGLGGFASGFVAQRFGLAWLYRGVAAGLALWCVCLPLLQWKAPRQRRINYSRLLAADTSEASDSESEPDWLDKAMQNDWSNNNNGKRANQ